MNFENFMWQFAFRESWWLQTSGELNEKGEGGFFRGDLDFHSPLWYLEPK